MSTFTIFVSAAGWAPSLLRVGSFRTRGRFDFIKLKSLDLGTSVCGTYMHLEGMIGVAVIALRVKRFSPGDQRPTTRDGLFSYSKVNYVEDVPRHRGADSLSS